MNVARLNLARFDRATTETFPSVAECSSERSHKTGKSSAAYYTYTIVTEPPGIVSRDIHDRAPVILKEGAWESWMGGEPADAPDVLNGTSEPKLVYHPVPKAVGSPKDDLPGLVEPTMGTS